MPHDGQDMMLKTNPILPDLLSLTQAALPAVDMVLERAKAAVRAVVEDQGRVSGALIEENQTAAHGLAWLATYAQSLHQMKDWAKRISSEDKFCEVEQLIQQIT